MLTEDVSAAKDQVEGAASSTGSPPSPRFSDEGTGVIPQRFGAHQSHVFLFSEGRGTGQGDCL